MADTAVTPSVGFTRWQASGLHLLISAAIAAVTLFVMLRVWYPPPMFMAEGGNDLIYTMVAVDVVLGPLITLIIFKWGKPGLRIDLAVIGLMQILALAYGCHTMFVARPVFIAFIVDRFETVRANDIDSADLAQAPHPDFRSKPLTGPKIVAIEMPKNINALKELISEAQKGGKVAQHLPRYYVPYSTQTKRALEQSKPLESSLKRGGEFAARAEKFLQDSRRMASDLRYLPLQTRRGFGAALLDAKTGDVVQLLPPPRV